MEQNYDAIEFTTRTSVPRLFLKVVLLVGLFAGAYLSYLWGMGILQTPLKDGGILFFLIFQVIEIFSLAYLILNWFCWYYEITEKEVILRRGVIMQTRKYYSLDKVESVSVEQGLWGRIFNYGAIELVMYYSDAPIKVVMMYVPRPKKYEKILQKNLREFGERDTA